MRRLATLMLFAATCAFAAGDEAPPTGWKAIAVPASEADYHCPVQSGATISQGNNGSFSHAKAFAWDYQVPIGTPVVAARSGVVVKCRTDSNLGGDRRFENDANEIRVRHTDGTEGFYFHLAKNANLVREGEFVLQGEIIALSGNTGFTTDPHLHFEVFRDGKSIPSAFSDFKSKKGVPDQGDRHGPPAPPAIPQTAMTAFKKLHRAARVAEARGLPDVGLAILQAAPEGKALADYYYARVLLAQRASFRTAVDAEIGRLTAAAATTFADALKVKRFQVALKDVAELRPALDKLGETERAFPEEIKRTFQTTSAAVTALVEGMRLECFEEVFDAGGKYMIARQASNGDLRAEVLVQVKRLIDLYLDGSVNELMRLRDESDRCLPEHKPVIKADADRVIKLCRSLFDYLKTYFPQDKASTGTDAKVVDYFYDKIVRNTK